MYSFPSVANMFIHIYTTRASQVALVVKNPPANAGESSSIPGSGRFPRRRKKLPTISGNIGIYTMRVLVGCSTLMKKVRRYMMESLDCVLFFQISFFEV